MDRILTFVKTNALLIVIGILLLAAIITSIVKENFEGYQSSNGLADYPGIFMEMIMGKKSYPKLFNEPEGKDMSKVLPYSKDNQYLQINSQQAEVPIEITKGLSVMAKVEIPAQVAEIPKDQIAQPLPEIKKSDVTISSQIVQLPAQKGVINAQVSDDGKNIKVPVDIPAQMIEIKEQKAAKGIVETFKL